VSFEVEEEFVELGRLHAGAGEHRVGLAAVVDLVLEEMGEQRVDALGDRAVRAAVGRDGAVGIAGGERVAEGDQAGVGGRLRRTQRRGFGVIGDLVPERVPPAAPFQRVDVLEVDGEGVVQRGAE
jgi:hypothetical protein